MKPASELTDLEARYELSELLGDVHYGDDSVLIIHKPYESSFDAIIPVIQDMDAVTRTIFRTELAYITELENGPYLFLDASPRQLLNAAIETLRIKAQCQTNR